MAGRRVGAEPRPEVERWRRRWPWQLGTECKVSGRVAGLAWPLGTPILSFFHGGLGCLLPLTLIRKQLFGPGTFTAGSRSLQTSALLGLDVCQVGSIYSLDNNTLSEDKPGWGGLQGRGVSWTRSPAGTAQGHVRRAGLQPGWVHGRHS